MRPSPVTGLLAMAGWAAFGAALLPVLLPPIPLYRTVVAAVALVLFALALATPRVAFVLTTMALAAAGVSALVAGSPEPAFAGPVLACGLLSGSALRRLYEIGEPPPVAPLLPLWRGLAVASALSAATAALGLRTSYLLLRSIPPPRVVNVLGDDVGQALLGVVSVLSSLAIAAGFHRAAAFLSRDVGGRRAVDAALVGAALVSGGVALLQKLELVPVWRALRWQEWGRVQGTFTDPSSAGVGVALLVAPLLAAASTGPALVRIAAGAGVPLLVSLLADAGSRAGFVGTLTATALFVLFALTRLAAGERPGARRRLASTVGGLAILSALAFAAALSWPGRGTVRSALLQRLAAPFEREPTPSERTGNRLLLYEGAFAVFREHPVAGIGLGAFRSEFPNVARNVLLRPVRTTDHPPSLYLGTLAESGLAGGALLLLLSLASLRGIARAFTLSETEPEEALRAAGAAASLTGLFVVFLFGSHLVYPEIAALAGLLTARLPLRGEGRTSRVLASVGPLVLAGALVLSAGGLVARGIESSTPEAAFEHDSSAGLYPVEREPDGRAFRWSGRVAAVRVTVPSLPSGRPAGPSDLSLPVRNARPDGRPVGIEVSWNDRLAGRVTLPRAGWYRLELPVRGSGVLLLRVDPPFRPGAGDARLLGVEVGPAPILSARRSP